jgi:antitoxin component HigA of HigAB toxin-antitoxin module
MKMSKAQLEEWGKLAESPIGNDEDHERALVAIRKLYGAAEGSEADQLRDRLFKLVAAYEKEEFPYGEANFPDWQAAQTEEAIQARLERVEEAEKVVSQEEFKRQRLEVMKKTLRERHIKQVDLARNLGADKSFINNVLKGRKEPNDHMISFFYYEAGVPIESLIPRPETFIIDKFGQRKRLIKAIT